MVGAVGSGRAVHGPSGPTLILNSAGAPGDGRREVEEAVPLLPAGRHVLPAAGLDGAGPDLHVVHGVEDGDRGTDGQPGRRAALGAGPPDARAVGQPHGLGERLRLGERRPAGLDRAGAPGDGRPGDGRRARRRRRRRHRRRSTSTPTTSRSSCRRPVGRRRRVGRGRGRVGGRHVRRLDRRFRPVLGRAGLPVARAGGEEHDRTDDHPCCPHSHAVAPSVDRSAAVSVPEPDRRGRRAGQAAAPGGSLGGSDRNSHRRCKRSPAGVGRDAAGRVGARRAG